jgi:hypothetical protein
VVDVAVMAGIIGPLALLVGVTLLLAAGSMWSRRLRDTGETVQGTVTDAEVVDSDAMNADHAVALAYRYRYDGTTHEGHDGVHPTTWDESDTPTGSADAPAVPSEYREGDVVSVEVSPDFPDEGTVPDPSFRATFRVAVPAIALIGLAAIALGAWLAL